MDLKQLSYFVTVVQEGSISAAARRLYLSQPPLSAQMKALEEEFGCVLFERGARKIQLTQAGRLLYDRATALLEMSEMTRREMLDYQRGSEGTLRL
ncbi:MAG: LysR family transcriptional regulator, partial [Oscillospiraceae bacterium]|nr:LysR family transcriptional regulator [Oscillospiraceae bacterium]